MTRRCVVWVWLPGHLLFMLGMSAPAGATDPGQGPLPPAHIAFLDGEATHERDGGSQRAMANVPVLPGDRLRTDLGRVELLFGDGTALHLDQVTSIDVIAPVHVRLLNGRLRLVASAPSGRTSRFSFDRIDALAAAIRAEVLGDYQIAIVTTPAGAEVELIVASGLARLDTAGGSVSVRAGERSMARDGERPTWPQPHRMAHSDAFDRWSAQRRDARAGGYSSRYLPSDLHPFATAFDRDGRWGPLAPYGYVWYPSAPDGWRPYYQGYWNHTGPYGWTWIGADPWAWPTHHYGRWGSTPGGVWFWIPMQVWGPAWVSWAIGPGYVSWCPLGFDGRPVFGFTGRVDPRFYDARGAYDPWRAWTVVPRRHFGPRNRVAEVAIDPHSLTGRPSPPFVVQQAPPPAEPGTLSDPVRSFPRRSLPVGQAIPRRGAIGQSAPARVFETPPLNPRDTPPDPPMEEEEGIVRRGRWDTTDRQRGGAAVDRVAPTLPSRPRYPDRFVSPHPAIPDPHAPAPAGDTAEAGDRWQRPAGRWFGEAVPRSGDVSHPPYPEEFRADDPAPFRSAPSRALSPLRFPGEGAVAPGLAVPAPSLALPPMPIPPEGSAVPRGKPIPPDAGW